MIFPHLHEHSIRDMKKKKFCTVKHKMSLILKILMVSISTCNFLESEFLIIVGQTEVDQFSEFMVSSFIALATCPVLFTNISAEMYL